MIVGGDGDDIGDDGDDDGGGVVGDDDGGGVVGANELIKRVKDELTKPRLLIFGSFHHCVARFPATNLFPFLVILELIKTTILRKYLCKLFTENIPKGAVGSYLWLVSVGFLLYLNVSQRIILF